MSDFQLEKILPAAFSPREVKLAQFAHLRHGKQVRKYNGAPYVTHLISVAVRVLEVDPDQDLTATALCHDLLEDTDCTKEALSTELLELGYAEEEVNRILGYVVELTDQFTSEQYPKLNRKNRKTLEANRLVSISPGAASVKLADLLDNMQSIAHSDRGFARVYFDEIGWFLPSLNKGNTQLFDRAMQVYEKEIKSLLADSSTESKTNCC